jgi:shikimate dehydrogenase
VNGADRYAVFGHPVAHSHSPWLHTRFAELTGQRIVYEARDVPPGQFDAALAAFVAAGGRGLNVTLPHKLAAVAAANRLTARAVRAGAVNTLSVSPEGLLGDNTDGAGLIADLERNLGLSLAGLAVLVVGAGGAARGVLPLLLDAHPARLAIANRSPAPAAELAARLAAEGPVEALALAAAHGPWDLVINATSASLTGERPALPDDAVGGRSVCYDLVYAAGPTPFLRWAAARGAQRTADGSGMLVEQAAESFSLWRGVVPPTAPVLAELRQRMARARRS